MEIIVVATMLLVVVLLGVAVKLYDLKRRREDEAVAAQARISDALLMDANLADIPASAAALRARRRGAMSRRTAARSRCAARDSPRS